MREIMITKAAYHYVGSPLYEFILIEEDDGSTCHAQGFHGSPEYLPRNCSEDLGTVSQETFGKVYERAEKVHSCRPGDPVRRLFVVKDPKLSFKQMFGI